jgi:hypothetical protein
VVTPVPARDFLMIKGLNITDDAIEMEIFNIEGRCILRRSMKPIAKLISETINLPGYSSGIYFVKIHGANTYLNQKIILY